LESTFFHRKQKSEKVKIKKYKKKRQLSVENYRFFLVPEERTANKFTEVLIVNLSIFPESVMLKTPQAI